MEISTEVIVDLLEILSTGVFIELEVYYAEINRRRKKKKEHLVGDFFIYSIFLQRNAQKNFE